MKKSIYNIKEVESFLEAAGFSHKDLRRSRRMLYREFVRPEDMPWEDDVKASFLENFETSYLKLVTRADSNIDGASKLLFETKDGKNIETVILRIETGRTSICLSSQVGCTEQCKFCATGEMGFFRNLKYEEVIDQLVQASRILVEEERKIRNIVFMGMGEPLRNYENLSLALDMLLNGRTFQFAHKFITVSSLGLPELIIKFAHKYPQVGIALSVNASNDESRSSIMPINDKYSMAELRAMIEELETIRESGVMIEYIMFEGINDSLKNAEELAEFLKGLEVHINLIPYNPDYSLDKSFTPSSKESVEVFQAHLKDKGYKVTKRFSLGQDIAAACGQLANKA
ncbi:MAG: 23S rRNA (adenine(2503)-C(2))-methyltransferase RlmN [Lentisphaeraceae bacterium]|nr:23S rRNA (adenine(2503)-C(2))-methyltransferase RlmN [Lentisphaeraceae bacterium]